MLHSHCAGQLAPISRPQHPTTQPIPRSGRTDLRPSSLQYVVWLVNSINSHTMTWGGGAMPPSCVPSPPTFSTPSRQGSQGTDSWPSSLQNVAWLADSIISRPITWEGEGMPPSSVSSPTTFLNHSRHLARVTLAAPESLLLSPPCSDTHVPVSARHTRPPRALTTSLQPSATRYVRTRAPVE